MTKRNNQPNPASAKHIQTFIKRYGKTVSVDNLTEYLSDTYTVWFDRHSSNHQDVDTTSFWSHMYNILEAALKAKDVVIVD